MIEKKSEIMIQFVNNLQRFTPADLGGSCFYSLLLLWKGRWVKVLHDHGCFSCQTCCRDFIRRAEKTVSAMLSAVGMLPTYCCAFI